MKSILSCVLSILVVQTNAIAVQTQTATPQAKTDKQSRQQPEPASQPVKPPLAFGLDDGTPVRLRINRTISSEDAKVGDTVDFEVLEDVNSHDVILIPRGGIALATITEAQSKRRMGRAGKLNVNIDNVKLVDGEKVALRAVKEVKGGSHTGAMTGAIVATAIVFFPAAPLFLFIKGKDITIPKGTEITAYINGDVPLDPKKFQPQDTAKTEAATSSTPVAASAENIPSTIELKSTPDGAEISIDGKYVGNTPTTLHLTVGDHVIKFEKSGFKPWERTLTITQGESTTIPVALEKLEVALPQ
jgi:PEGA domain-containing protein